MSTQFTQNGKIEPQMCYETSCIKFHKSGVSGIFPEVDSKII